MILPVISEFSPDTLKPAVCLQFLLLTMAALGDKSPERWNQTAIENLSTLFSANQVRRKATCIQLATSYCGDTLTKEHNDEDTTIQRSILI